MVPCPLHGSVPIDFAPKAMLEYFLHSADLMNMKRRLVLMFPKNMQQGGSVFSAFASISRCSFTET